MSSFYNFNLKLAGEHKRYSRKILENIEINSKTTILDVGAGSGLLAEYLSKYTSNITLMEPSNNMLKKASKEFEQINLSIQECSKVRKEYDVVLCIESMHHFSNGYKNGNREIILGLKALHRLSKGKVVIIEPNTETLRSKWIAFVENFIFRMGSYFMSEREFRKVLNSLKYKYTLEKWGKYFVVVIDKK